MKKIISMFLLLSLVFQISIPTVYAEGLPPGGHTYDIGEGDIEITQGTDAGTLKVTYASGENIPGITQDNIPKDTILTLTGTSTGTSELERIKKVAIKGGVVANITFSKLAIKSVCTVDISEKSQVNLTLVGKNELINSRNNSGEGLGAGLCVSEGSTLTIMAKSVGELTAAGSVGGAGIGGGYKEVGGTVTINGGAITATGGGGSNYGGAGIGGGSSGAGGIVTITGGSVQATGGQHGAGIGGGSDGAGGAVTISSGTVTATAGGNGAGIGGGVSGVGGRVTISGGTIIATAGSAGAGIGGGNNGAGGEVTISGGVVTAIGKGMSSNNGAGIGGGSKGVGGAVTISGGTVTATGGQTGDVSRHAAGIGQGDKAIGTAVEGTFAATENAFVMASSIGDKKYQEQSSNTQGIIFENKNGVTYGNPSIVWDAQIPANHTLTVGENQSITLNQDATLTNGGTLINNGSLIINRDLLEGVEGGNISGEGTFISLGDIDIKLPSKQYTGSVMTPTIMINQPTILGKVFNSNIATTYNASHEKKSADGNWISGAEIKDAGDYRVLYEQSGKIPFFKAYSIEKANYPGLNIKEITGKKYGDQFTLEMIGGPADVIYSVPEGNGILSIDGNTATATGAGTVTLTASRLGDANHHGATGTRSVTLAKKELLVTANDHLDLPAGTVIPELTYTVSGLVDGDTLTDLELVSTVTDINQAGDYVINISGGTLTNANNYEVTYISGQLVIKVIKTHGDYTYEETNKGLTIRNYSGTGEVLIPSTIDGKHVTSIGDKAFWEKGLTSVTIPESIQSIGDLAFDGNEDLGSVTILGKETLIGSMAFGQEIQPTIYGYPGSTAQAYPEEHRKEFIALVLVTTTSAGIEVALTGGGVHIQGSSVSLTAPLVPSHNFIGWYKAAANEVGYEGNQLSKDHVYTSVFEENRSLVAVYQPLSSEDFIVTIDGGSSYTINVSDTGATEYTEAHTGSYAFGTPVTVAVTNTEDFAYWAGGDGSGKILSRQPSYSFVVTEPMTLTAVYKTEKVKATVIFESLYGQIMSRMELGIDDEITVPNGPTRYGYTFNKWSMSEAEIKDQITTGAAMVLVLPEYDKWTDQYEIDIQGGTGSGTYDINDVVTAIAPTIELNTGNKFSHWSANTIDNILSYSDVYKFYVTKGLTITANYVEEDIAIKQKGTTQISETKKDSENNKLIFVSMATVPQDCKILKAGIIATNNEAVGTSGNNFNKNAPGVLVRGDAWTGNAYRFTWTKNVSSDEKWYVRSYLLYEDAQKNLFTVYGNMVSQTLRAGQ